MKVKNQILRLIEAAAAVEADLIDGLDPEELIAEEPGPGWPAKALVAHIAAWNGFIRGWLEAAARGEEPADVNQEDFNEAAYQAQRTQSWDQVREEARRAREALAALVRDLPEPIFTDADRFPWREGRPLWRSVLGTAYSHAMSHYAEYYHGRGQVARASALEEASAKAGLEILDDPEWHGIVLYNLACFYGRTGQAAPALRNLANALALRPDLTEWSREDPDFEPIRGSEDYQALVGRQAG